MSEPGWKFENTYARLPPEFFVRQNPVPVRQAKLVKFNHALAKELGLNGDALAGGEGAEVFAGNALPAGAEPIAQAYAGHQFGHFNMLGDGRAVLLGEHVAPNGQRFDIQLKGSGQTPFSRRGDGRAALGPMLREYIMSEAMHALGIPTTRSLAVVTTGETTYREKPLPGAILTRVAASHIRVGTFEYAAATGRADHVRALADYTIHRHYPELALSAEPYLDLLRTVMDRQAHLIARWMQVGFIHGVMNTDNMTLSGETIDFGPCAFMNSFSPTTVFSSIDRQGRYAYGNQPRIAEWNLTRLAETLVPLLGPDQERAVAKAKDALAGFAGAFGGYWHGGMRAKLGLTAEREGDAELVESLLVWMNNHKADYTNTFRALTADSLPDEEVYRGTEFSLWHARWRERRLLEYAEESRRAMQNSNPVVIPRNHRVEEALSAAVDEDDFSKLEKLLLVLRHPFAEIAANSEFRAPPTDESEYQTFCGT